MTNTTNIHLEFVEDDHSYKKKKKPSLLWKFPRTGAEECILWLNSMLLQLALAVC